MARIHRRNFLGQLLGAYLGVLLPGTALSNGPSGPLLEEALQKICALLLSRPPADAVARDLLESLRSEGVRVPRADFRGRAASTPEQILREIESTSPDPEELNRLIWRALQLSLRRLDAYSDAMSPRVYNGYLAAQREDYCGVGMDLERDDAGRFYCYPYAQSPAEKAGIKRGAELKAVDGISIEGLSVYEAGALVRGPAGEPVKLRFGGLLGFGKELGFLRRPVKRFTVGSGLGPEGLVLHIETFGTETPNEVLSHLRATRPTRLTLDLRACRGGDLDAAIQVAGFFLREGLPIVTLESTTAGKLVRTARGSYFSDSLSIHILQDGKTASSAELLIAALVNHGRASSSGPRTYGKGVSQQVLPLSSGGALVLTTGRMMAPLTNRSWHQTGLSASR
jgi:carboxyl-terminal processing protease